MGENELPFRISGHEIIRQNVKWGSNGINGDKPTKNRPIYEISNSHLENIIKWIKINFDNYNDDILKIMTDEVIYRQYKNIFIPDYEQDN